MGFGNGGSNNFGYIRVPGGADVTLDLNGHNIDRALTSPTGSNENTAGWVIGDYGTLTIEDSSTTNVTKQGNITGGKNSYATYSAGGIYVDGSHTLNINGGNITGNKAINWGGGIYVKSSSTVKMTGGKIYDNIANYDKNDNGGGGAIYTNGRFEITGGEISENRTYDSTKGGGIYIGSGGSITVGGTAIIKYNYTGETTGSDGHEENIYLNSKTITCSTGSPLTYGAHIGVTTENKPSGTTPVAITKQNSADYSGYFVSNNTAYQIYNEDNIVKLRVPVSVPAFDLRDGSIIQNKKPTGTLKWGDNDAKDNYTFAGWYDGIDGTGNLLGTEAAGTNGKTYYAKWTKTFGEGADSVTHTVRTRKLNLQNATTAQSSESEGWSWVYKGTAVNNMDTISDNKCYGILTLSGFTLNTVSDTTALIFNGDSIMKFADNNENNVHGGDSVTDDNCYGILIYIVSAATTDRVSVIGDGTLNVTSGNVIRGSTRSIQKGSRGFSGTILIYEQTQKPTITAKSGQGVRYSVGISGVFSYSSGATINAITSGVSTNGCTFNGIDRLGIEDGMVKAIGGAVKGYGVETINFIRGGKLYASGGKGAAFEIMEVSDGILVLGSADFNTAASNLKPTYYYLDNYENYCYFTDDNCPCKTLATSFPPSISVGGQAAALTYGTAGGTTFTVTASHFGVNYPDYAPVIEWVTASHEGVTIAVNGSDNKQIDASISATVNAGEYKFKVVSPKNPATDGNYESADVTLTVSKADATTEMKEAHGDVSDKGKIGATVTLPALPDGASYDNISYAGSITFSNATASGTTLTFDAPASTAGQTGTITLKVINATNYKDYFVVVTITSVAKSEVTISGVSVANKTYDGDASAYSGTPTAVIKDTTTSVTIAEYTYTWQIKGDGGTYTNIAENEAPKKVGDYRLVVAVAEDNEAYTGSANIDFTISKKAVTITGVTALDKTYDGTTTATPSGSAVINGIIESDIVTVNAGAAEFDDKNVGNGKTVTFSGYDIEGADSGNYNLTEQPTNVTANITQATISIIGNGTAAVTKPYDGKTDKGTFSGALEISGNVNGDAVSVNAVPGAYAVNDIDAGTGKTVTLTLELDGADKGNYVLASTTYAFNSAVITKANATTAMKEASGEVLDKGKIGATVTLPALPDGASYDIITYGGAINFSNATASGTTLTFDAPASTAGQTGTITLKVINATNYDVYFLVVTITSFAKTEVTITPNITISGLTDGKRTYNGDDSAFSGTPTAVDDQGNPITIANYTYTWQIKDSSGSYNDIPGNAKPKDAGDYRLVVSVSDDNANYIGSVNIDFTIEKMPVTVKADDKTMTVNGTLPTFTITYSGFVGTENENNAALETAAAVNCAADGTTAGVFDIEITTQAALNDGAGKNYTITAQNNGTLTVKDKVFTVVFNPNGGIVIPLAIETNSDGKLDFLPIPVRSGIYRFCGWYTMTGRLVTLDTEFTNSTIVTAKWIDISKTVVFDANGGSVAPTSAKTNSVHKLDSLPTPTRSGKYSFDGWYTADGTLVTTDTIFIVDTTITARWTYTGGGNTSPSVGGGLIPGFVPYDTDFYTLRFNTNGGTSVNDVMKVAGTTIELSGCTTTRDGYTFCGWYGDSKLTNLLTSVKLTGNITIYAKWTENTEPDEQSQTELPFTDVKADDWFSDDVKFVYENELMLGTTDTIFDPYLTVTRGMLVTILWRMENEPVSDKAMTFGDVAEEEYYFNAVKWAAENEIVMGFDEATFGPDANITHEQLAAILFRYAKFKGYDVSVGESTNILSYYDAESIDEWAIPAMQWACGVELIGDAGNPAPKDEAQRCQVAAMLHSFCEKVK